MRRARSTRTTLAVALAFFAVELGCGKYGPPTRPEGPSYDTGTVYDAGQPIDPGTPTR